MTERPDQKFEAEPAKLRSVLGFQEFLTDQKRSAFAKYRELVVDDQGLFSLLKYELLILLLTNVPGIPGLFLRQKLYKLLLKDLGKGTAIGMGVSLRQPSKIWIGRSCVIDDLASLSARGARTSGIRLTEDVFVGRGTILNVRNGVIEVGKSTAIGSQCRIAAFEGTVSIGSGVLIAAFCYIGAGNYKANRTDIAMALQGREKRGGVTIEDDVWIGAQTVIADGVRIGKSTIIGAGSYVNKDIPEYSIAFGCPASVYKKRT